jgi:hypothetical protein
MANELLNELKKATEGLLYPSESDSPLEPFVWENAENAVDEVRRLSNEPAERPCRAESVEEFFEMVEEAKGFPELYRTLRGILTDMRVYRFGGIEVAVYLVGRAADGRLAGFKTMSVET